MGAFEVRAHLKLVCGPHTAFECMQQQGLIDKDTCNCIPYPVDNTCESIQYFILSHHPQFLAYSLLNPSPYPKAYYKNVAAKVTYCSAFT